MRIVHTEDLNIVAAGSTDYQMDRYGAKSVVWTPQGCGANTVSFLARNNAGTLSQLIMLFAYGSSQGEDEYPLSFPVGTDVLRLTRTTTGPLAGRLDFVDEYLPPRGRASLGASSTSVNAATTLEIVPLLQFGMFRSFTIAAEFTKAGTLLLNHRVSGQTVALYAAATIAAATGGVILTPNLPMPSQLRVAWRNDDGAANGSLKINILGHLDANAFNT